MADPTRYPDANSETDGDIPMGPDRGSPPPTPRWVKVSGIVALVLILLVGIMLMTGLGGNHGPGRHMPSSNPTGYILPVERGMIPS
ncbi:MAG: hypothetical protein NTZ05_23075 [Chloroflexi bacterium]|nr:hypothetical protein [Chloroflexota bacterium]